MDKVLVVDDSLIDRRIISKYLLKAGLKVFNAQSAEEAKAKIPQYQPKLIILDVLMQGQSGFEMCRELKQKSETKSIRVILCSSKSTEADRILGKALGADAYFVKPIEPREFVEKVKELIQG